jgi:2-polyprenyl-3-methyl-5-hydroxy-6-metoxy-1,4-benzoquinol methylase
MASYVKNECPVCKYKRFSIIGGIKERDTLVQVPDGSAIVKCRYCRLIYVNPMPHWDSEDFAKLYNETYFSYFESDEQRKWFNIREKTIPEKRFKKIAQYIESDNKRMLEIGAGEYAFMCKYLIAKGWEATAQEPCEMYANKLRHLAGLIVETKDIKEIDADGTFSFIFADSVLEHVPDPVVLCKKLSNLLLPGGVLYIVSPNEYSVYNFLSNLVTNAKGVNPHYIAPYVKPYHLLGYTKKSLEILGEKSNLRLVSYKKIDDYRAFNAINSKKSFVIKYPLAALYAISQCIGLGTNSESLFIKSSIVL